MAGEVRTGRGNERSRAGVKTSKAKSKDTTRPERARLGEALRKVQLMGPWEWGRGGGVTGERTTRK